jgi:NOL1/NOP2/fmu family ribosome biogenesis protein
VDLNGREVERAQIESGFSGSDISMISAGIYPYTIVSPGNRIIGTGKWVKK